MKTKKRQELRLLVPESITDQRVMRDFMGQSINELFQKYDDVLGYVRDFSISPVQTNGTARCNLVVKFDPSDEVEHSINVLLVLEEVRERGDAPFYSVSASMPDGTVLDAFELLASRPRLASLGGLDPTRYESDSAFLGRWITIDPAILNRLTRSEVTAESQQTHAKS